MADSSAESSRVGAHDSILETGVEMGCAPLDGDAVFEGPRGHHFAVLQSDELDGAESAREHLTKVGKDTGSHPGGAGASARFHVIVRSVHHTLVFGVLDRLVGLDGGGSKTSEGIGISVSACNAFSKKLLPREGEGLS